LYAWSLGPGLNIAPLLAPSANVKNVLGQVYGKYFKPFGWRGKCLIFTPGLNIFKKE
jgi:hypothetical protein